jgi:hypothetical protein
MKAEAIRFARRRVCAILPHGVNPPILLQSALPLVGRRSSIEGRVIDSALCVSAPR